MRCTASFQILTCRSNGRQGAFLGIAENKSCPVRCITAVFHHHRNMFLIDGSIRHIYDSFYEADCSHRTESAYNAEFLHANISVPDFSPQYTALLLLLYFVLLFPIIFALLLLLLCFYYCFAFIFCFSFTLYYFEISPRYIFFKVTRSSFPFPVNGISSSLNAFLGSMYLGTLFFSSFSRSASEISPT